MRLPANAVLALLPLASQPHARTWSQAAQDLLVKARARVATPPAVFPQEPPGTEPD
jgi:hypothetical protein